LADLSPTGAGTRPNGGRFITFEGVEGAGKSTQIAELARVLQSRGVEVLVTREPGGTALGERLRELVLGFEPPPSPVAELFLILADRAQHVAEVIRPALEAGRWVLADRYIDATRAYQVGGRGLDRDLVERAMSAATEGLCPDLTLLLDLPAEIGLERVGRRGAGNRLDQEEIEFHRRVRNAYLKELRAEPRRIKRIDATLEPGQVHVRVVHAVTTFLNR
jgi:dTMP kinase